MTRSDLATAPGAVRMVLEKVRMGRTAIASISFGRY